MALDAQTQRNLEIFQGARSGGGGRLAAFRHRRDQDPDGRPALTKVAGPAPARRRGAESKAGRHRLVCGKRWSRRQVIAMLKDVADLERLINRVRGEIAIPRELVALRRSLETVPKLKEILENVILSSRAR